ncbi:PREDICTED: cyclin-D1-binding protein 1 homolog [Nelumbo nucifera]|uniref:Cyclin-D1-binding protein 1 homolog n=2 Tax=Nelumbo nucifera TaxID=4432 RepID=A0A1U8BD48_NELNU|nr:PREDICTED: cyclin-D1-binding protein 1 homolog [Nelumbo nucifera]DAD31935.1 TPA_asm: hypothetical protein HUJ06_010786 [Nelumbo nucifera]
MGKAVKEHLARALNSHLNSIHETFQVLYETPASSLEKVTWEEVVQMGEQLSKQATVAGMLWTGEAPDVNQLEENMGSYFNMLQGFLLLSHGSTVGAGPTLRSNIHASAKQVVDCSLALLKEAVSSYGSHDANQKRSIPPLAGAVWDACIALKKTPTTNYTAIGRAITQVAVSLKDVLREMKELKPGTTDPADKISDETASDPAGDPPEDDDSSEGDLGNDLSLEEMKIAQSTIDVVSNTLAVIKELIRYITGLLKQSSPNGGSHSVDSLEKLLKICQGIGIQVDELGACLYPPQEIPALKAAAGKITNEIKEMQAEVRNLKGPSEGFFQACEGLENSVRKLEAELDCSSDAADLAPQMQNLDLSV